MDSYAYCQGEGHNGITCAESDLELISAPIHDADTIARHTERIYRCRRCGGLYKHVYDEKYETRFMDCDEGWWTTEDQYYKVAKPWTRDAEFPIEEARRYGYHGPEEELVDGRCAYPREPNGLTCRFSTLAELARPDKATWIRRCRRCGQLYKQIREPPHRFYRPGESARQRIPFPLAEARLYGYRGES